MTSEDTSAATDGPAPAVPPTLLEEFVAVIAHELATPLAVVASASQLALDTTGGDEQQRHLLEMIRRNTDLAILLLGRLGLARDIEADDVTLDPTTLDLAQLVRESVDDLRTVALAGHPVEVTVGSSPVIRADATALREILFNLLSNAAKYSAPEAAIDVHVDVDDEVAYVVVRNHGTGVTPGDDGKIFDKFFQRDQRSSGAGLGLFISRGLARAHGGDIEVQPAADEGSEFRLSLPA